MSILEGMILGVIQGITEFFPVSSSGHLVIFRYFLDIQETSLLFEVLVHLGTLVAVVVVFWEDVVSLIRRPFQKLSYLILAGVIPTAIIGFVFHDAIAQMFESVTATAVMMLVTGLILWFVDIYASGRKPLGAMGYGEAVFVGLAQGLAIMPGLSRSGTTIAASLITGLDRQAAPRYSFLLSIPVILGATFLEAKDFIATDFSTDLLIPYLVGMLAASIAGYFAIRLFVRFVRQGKLHYFSYYCWTVGMMVLLWQLL